MLKPYCRTIRQEKELKGIKIGKGVKLFLFIYDVTLYIENCKEFIHTKILVLINEFSKLTRSTHRNQLCFNTPAKTNLKRKLRK